MTDTERAVPEGQSEASTAIANRFQQAIMQAITDTAKQHDGGLINANAVLGALAYVTGLTIAKIPDPRLQADLYGQIGKAVLDAIDEAKDVPPMMMVDKSRPQ